MSLAFLVFSHIWSTISHMYHCDTSLT